MKKEGFTLVEVLIVITIIGILSVTAIGGYTSYRKTALLELSADNLISQINELRDKTIHGNFGVASDGTTAAKCYGVSVNAGKIYSFEVNFLNKKKWNGTDFSYQGCADEATAKTTPLEMDEQIGITVNDFVLTFAPPQGVITLNPAVSDEKLDILLQYGVGVDDAYKRHVIYDLKSGKASVTKIQDV